MSNKNIGRPRGKHRRNPPPGFCREVVLYKMVSFPVRKDLDSMPDLTVKIRNVTLKNPLIIASGTPDLWADDGEKMHQERSRGFCHQDALLHRMAAETTPPPLAYRPPRGHRKRRVFLPPFHGTAESHPARGVRPEKDEGICQGGPRFRRQGHRLHRRDRPGDLGAG